MTSEFGLGQIVRLRADPSRRGPITAVLPPIGGQVRYRVFHAGNEIVEYHERQLVADTEHAHPPAQRTLRDLPFLEVEEFRPRFTAVRLSHRLVDTLYAVHAARIQHIPFQFKPLLRFLRSD